MKKIKVATGIYWVEIPEAGLNILCGCPADCVKHLMKKGLIAQVEKDGVKYQTGPNAILLSDVSLQNERFCNLGEFPVLQMLYFQGMILPGHPGNTGVRPMLIGLDDQVRAQAEYIYRGNYGLVSEEELIEAGLSPAEAAEQMRMKLKFAFGSIKRTDELLDLKALGDEPLEIRTGAFVRRIASNVFEFTFGDESLTIDLNLAEDESYEAAYPLGHYELEREYFSIVHNGEGDGWDVNRPCMGSIVVFQGKIYLIDVGPNMVHSLNALGIGISEIEGIFHTHAHDDHFNGLTVLMRSDHRLKYFATPLVRASVLKKFTALTNIPPENFPFFFDVHDLELDTWNNIEGLEVMPVLSPHPVETTVMFFRALWEDGYKTYAHLADTTGFDVLRGMVSKPGKNDGISQEFHDRTIAMYLTPVDVKKIDIGGGLIHGRAEDFKDDTSGKLLLSHTAQPLSHEQMEIGESTTFGVRDVLIGATQDYSKQVAHHYMSMFFPEAPRHELQMLLNCPEKTFMPGSLIIRKGEKNCTIYFILSGVLDFIDSDRDLHNKLTAGSIVGEISGILESPTRGAFRAFTTVKSLAIPCGLYMEFLNRNGLLESTRSDISRRSFLQQSWLFGELVSCPIKNRIARSMERVNLASGQSVGDSLPPGVFLVEDGEIGIHYGGKLIETVGSGGFFGEDTITFGDSSIFDERATKGGALLWHIPAPDIQDIPIVQWKLFETFERRMKALGRSLVDS